MIQRMEQNPFNRASTGSSRPCMSMLVRINLWKDETDLDLAEAVAAINATGLAFDDKLVAKCYGNCSLSDGGHTRPCQIP